MAPVILALREKQVDHHILLTCQHPPKVCDGILDWFGIPWQGRVRINLKHGPSSPLTLGGCAGATLAGFQPYMSDSSLILVQGDTTSAWAGAIAGFLAGVPVMHVEAGLRTYNLSRPFPEEFYRQSISKVTKYHCAPTAAAVRLLDQEDAGGYHEVTGNTIVDATNYTRERCLEETPTKGPPFVLCTMHRRESIGATMASICGQLRELVNVNPDIQLILPMHPNPEVRDVVRVLNHDRIRLIEPLSYPEFVATLSRAIMVVTDSGGVQEEAATLGIPCVVMREETDRYEGVESGNAVLAGTKLVFQVASNLLNNPLELDKMRKAENPFGDGKASQRIADWVSEIVEEELVHA